MNSTLHKSIKVTFLLDKSNNWIEQHLRDSDLLRLDHCHDLKISHDHTKVIGQDIVFILGYTRILNKAFLSRNRLNLVVHESDLPRGKGFAPVQWQILEGKNSIPVCLIEAADNVDAGDILFRSTIDLSGDELYEEIRTLQAEATFNIIRQFLEVYPNYTRERQIGDESFYPRRRVSDGELDVDKSIREQFNLLRIGSNEGWPSFFCLNNQKYILKISKGEMK